MKSLSTKKKQALMKLGRWQTRNKGYQQKYCYYILGKKYTCTWPISLPLLAYRISQSTY